MSLLESLSALAPLSSVPRDGRVRQRRLGDLKAAGSLRSESPVFGTSQSPRRLSAPGSQSRHLNAYAGGDDAVDWVMNCAALIADTAASAPRHFERDGAEVVLHKTDALPSDVEEAPADLVHLFEQPNPYTSWGDLISLTVIDYLVAGNAWWLKFKPDDDGRPLGLFRMHPAHVTTVQSKQGGVAYFEYNPPGGGGALRINADEVLHFKRPNPHDEFYGAGVIAGAPRVYDLELYLTESQTSYFERGTRLSGVLETDSTITETVFQRVKRRFKDLYAGRGNAYNVAVLERGLKYNTIQNSASEANYAELSTLSRDRILAAFRVPLSLLGVDTGTTGQSKEEDQRVFDNKLMRPLLDKLQRAITTEVTEAWGLTFVFEYEYLPPKEDQLELAGIIATLPGVKVREVRAAAGYEPLGDERDEIVLNLPGENDNASGVKDRSLPGEAGRPPLGENTAAFDDPNSLPADAEARSRPDQSQPVKQGRAPTTSGRSAGKR